jgi:hypothetical protein
MKKCSVKFLSLLLQTGSLCRSTVLRWVGTYPPLSCGRGSRRSVRGGGVSGEASDKAVEHPGNVHNSLVEFRLLRRTPSIYPTCKRYDDEEEPILTAIEQVTPIFPSSVPPFEWPIVGVSPPGLSCFPPLDPRFFISLDGINGWDIFPGKPPTMLEPT